MAQDAITAIREAESKALQITSEAEQNRMLTVKNAQKFGETLRQRQITDARANAAELLSQAQDEAQVEMEQMDRDEAQAQQALSQRAMQNMQKAVDAIVGRI